MSIKCQICGIEREDLTKHLISAHGLSVNEYKERYGKTVIDVKINKKRKVTNLELYGDENYRNREAIKLSNEIYEGGHSLSDPEIREKGRVTKKKVYGDPNYTNREQAKKTNLKKYGYENPNSVPKFIKKRVATNIERYGKVFNHIKESKPIPEDLEEYFGMGLTMFELALKYGVSEPVVSKWVRAKDLVRKGREYPLDYICSKNDPIEAIKEIHSLFGKCGRDIIRNIKGFPVKVWKLESQYGTWDKFLKEAGIVIKKESVGAEALVKKYVEYCSVKGIVLSFYKYSLEVKDSTINLKLKRLFNKGKKYSHLKEELALVVLKPELWPEFLKKFSV